MGGVDYILIDKVSRVIREVNNNITGLMALVLIISIPIIIGIEMLYLNFRYKEKEEKGLVGIVLRDAKLAQIKALEKGSSVFREYFFVKINTLIMQLIVAMVLIGYGNTIIKIVSKIAGNIIDVVGL